MVEAYEEYEAKEELKNGSGTGTCNTDEIYGGRELYHSLLCSRGDHERAGKMTGAR